MIKSLGLRTARAAPRALPSACPLASWATTVVGSDEQHGVPGQDRFAPEGDGKMRLADARRSEQQHVLAIGDPAGAGELTDLLGIDRGLRREVKAGEVAHEREARELQRHLDAPLVLAGNLALAEQDEGLAQAQLLPAGFVEQPIELIADGGELESREHIGQAIGSGMHQKPPPSSASYSPSERSSVGGNWTADEGRVLGRG